MYDDFLTVDEIQQLDQIAARLHGLECYEDANLVAKMIENYVDVVIMFSRMEKYVDKDKMDCDSIPLEQLKMELGYGDG